MPSLRRTVWAVLCAFSCGAAAQDGGWGACPREALTRMFEASAEYAEVADIAAIEREVLRLCNLRQGLINKIVEGEARLAELRGQETPTGSGTGAVEAVPLARATESAPAKKVAPVAAVVEEEEEAEEEAPPAEPVVVEVARAAAPPLRWTSVYGSAGEWIAGVSDGERVWFVRAGDALPSGERVVDVRVRPPGVTVRREGTRWQLPGPGT